MNESPLTLLYLCSSYLLISLLYHVLCYCYCLCLLFIYGIKCTGRCHDRSINHRGWSIIFWFLIHSKKDIFWFFVSRLFVSRFWLCPITRVRAMIIESYVEDRISAKDQIILLLTVSKLFLPSFDHIHAGVGCWFLCIIIYPV